MLRTWPLTDSCWALWLGGIVGPHGWMWAWRQRRATGLCGVNPTRMGTFGFARRAAAELGCVCRERRLDGPNPRLSAAQRWRKWTCDAGSAIFGFVLGQNVVHIIVRRPITNWPITKRRRLGRSCAGPARLRSPDWAGDRGSRRDPRAHWRATFPSSSFNVTARQT